MGMLLASLTQMSLAHNPLIATYLLKKEGQQWQLNVLTTLNTLHQSLLKKFEKKNLIMPDGNYNQKIAFNYLKENIKIMAHNKILTLHPLVADINNHQSRFTFNIESIEIEAGEIYADIPAMSDTLGQHNLFRVRLNNKQRHIMLHERNNFKGSVKVPI